MIAWFYITISIIVFIVGLLIIYPRWLSLLMHPNLYCSSCKADIEHTKSIMINKQIREASEHESRIE